MAGQVRNLNDVHDDAAVWMSRIERGLTPAEQDQFNAWIAEDPERAEILARQSAILTAVQTAGFDTVTVEAVASSSNARQMRGRGWGQAVMAAGALAASLVLMLGVYVLGADSQPQAAPVPVHLASASAVQSDRLADGSQVWLDAHTDLALEYSEAERRIRLAQGGVFAEVAHNRERPFIVEAGSVSVTAVGTAFEVQARNGRVSVLVEEGVVRVVDAATGASRLLEAGWALHRGPEGGWSEPVSAEPVAGWRSGRIQVRSESVGALARRLSLYRSSPILIDGTALSEVRVSGVFSIEQEDADAMPLALADSVGACAAPQPSGAIVITRNTMLCP